MPTYCVPTPGKRKATRHDSSILPEARPRASLSAREGLEAGDRLGRRGGHHARRDARDGSGRRWRCSRDRESPRTGALLEMPRVAERQLLQGGRLLRGEAEHVVRALGRLGRRGRLLLGRLLNDDVRVGAVEGEAAHRGDARLAAARPVHRRRRDGQLGLADRQHGVEGGEVQVRRHLLVAQRQDELEHAAQAGAALHVAEVGLGAADHDSRVGRAAVTVDGRRWSRTRPGRRAGSRCREPR